MFKKTCSAEKISSRTLKCSKRLAPALLRCTGDHAAHRTTRQAGGVGCLCAVVSVHRPLSVPPLMSVSFLPQDSVGARQCRWNGRAPSTFPSADGSQNRSWVSPSSSGTTAGIRTGHRGIARLRQHGNTVARCLFSGSARIDGSGEQAWHDDESSAVGVAATHGSGASTTACVSVSVHCTCHPAWPLLRGVVRDPTPC